MRPIALGCAVFAFVEMLFLSWYLVSVGASEFIAFGWALFLMLVATAVFRTLDDNVRAVVLIATLGVPLLPSLLITGLDVFNIMNGLSVLLLVALVAERRMLVVCMILLFFVFFGAGALHVINGTSLHHGTMSVDPIDWARALLHFGTTCVSPLVAVTMLPRLVWEELAREYRHEQTASAVERVVAPQPWTEIRLWVTADGAKERGRSPAK